MFFFFLTVLNSLYFYLFSVSDANLTFLGNNNMKENEKHFKPGIKLEPSNEKRYCLSIVAFSFCGFLFPLLIQHYDGSFSVIFKELHNVFYSSFQL